MEYQSDNLYIQQILAGHIQDFSFLVSKYQSMVFTICLRIFKNREEAEDIAQESFIKCFQSLNQFKGESKFSSWLYTITYNTCMNRVKYNVRCIETEDLDDISNQEIAELEQVFSKIEQTEQSNLIQQAISHLPTVEQLIIQLYYYDELTLKEISNILSLTIENIKIKLFRSRKRLFTLMSTHSQFSILQYE